MPKPNGHVKQLRPEQQLALGRIQKRVFQYQIQASAHIEEARRLADLARAADVEFQNAVRDHATRLGVDLNVATFDSDKLQFAKKATP